MKRTFWLLSAVIAGLQLFPSAQAAPNSDDLLELSLADLLHLTVTTASRQAESAADAPGTVLVITQQQIRERGYVHLYHLLEDLPGVDTHSYASNMEFNRISLRGIVRNDKFIVMQDGVRINSPSGEPVPISDNFPLYHAKQVEVVYGPASALYGADAFTGVINIITQSAQEANGVELAVLGGEFGSRALYANAATPLGAHASLSAGAHWQEADNPNLAEFYPEDFTLGDLVTFSGETVIKAADRHGYAGDTRSKSAYFKLALTDRFTLGGNYWSFHHRTDTAARPDTANYGADAYWHSRLTDVYANYQFDFTGNLSGFVQFDYARYEVSPQSRFANIYTNFTDGYKYARGTKKQLDAQLEYRLGENSSLIGGLSVADYFSQPKPVDLFKPFDPDLPPSAQGFYYLGSNNTLPANLYQLNYDNFGAYLQWRQAWSEQLTSTLGIRYDHSSSYGDSVNPRLGLVYRPHATTTLKLLYGTAFLAPSPFLAYEHFGSFSGQADAQGRYISEFLNIPNPNLKPEQIQTVEANLSHRFTPNWEARASLYYNQAQDIIASAPADPQQPEYIPGGVIRYTQYNANIGQADAYGGDISMDYLHRLHGGGSLKLWGNYSYTDGELERDDQAMPLPNVAKHKFKLGLTYNKGAFTLSPKLLWSDAANTDQEHMADAYARFDVHGEWRATKNLRLSVTVWNILDKRYHQVTDGISSSFVAAPQDPRRIYAGVVYQFE